MCRAVRGVGVSTADREQRVRSVVASTAGRGPRLRGVVDSTVGMGRRGVVVSTTSRRWRGVVCWLPQPARVAWCACNIVLQKVFEQVDRESSFVVAIQM